jgi:hypothetical protein
LDRYYWLLDLAEKYEIFKKVGTRYQVGEASYYAKTIQSDPEKYFTEDILKIIEEKAKMEFSYGQSKWFYSYTWECIRIRYL